METAGPVPVEMCAQANSARTAAIRNLSLRYLTAGPALAAMYAQANSARTAAVKSPIQVSGYAAAERNVQAHFARTAVQRNRNIM